MGSKGSRRSRRSDPGGGAGSDPRGDRKTLQLCREAREALGVALGALGDEALADAWVMDVVPDPDASHLRVLVVAPPDADVREVVDALHRSAGVLRSEVASAITRKRVPLLSFQVEKEVEL